MKVKVEPILFRGLPQLRVSVSTDGKNFEIINIKAVLNLSKWLFRSEDLRYPREDGFQGKYKLLRAISEVCEGCSVEETVKKHGCRDAERDIIEWVEKPPEEEWEEWVKNTLRWNKWQQ